MSSPHPSVPWFSYTPYSRPSHEETNGDLCKYFQVGTSPVLRKPKARRLSNILQRYHQYRGMQLLKSSTRCTEQRHHSRTSLLVSSLPKPPSSRGARESVCLETERPQTNTTRKLGPSALPPHHSLACDPNISRIDHILLTLHCEVGLVQATIPKPRCHLASRCRMGLALLQLEAP